MPISVNQAAQVTSSQSIAPKAPIGNNNATVTGGDQKKSTPKAVTGETSPLTTNNINSLPANVREELTTKVAASGV